MCDINVSCFTKNENLDASDMRRNVFRYLFFVVRYLMRKFGFGFGVFNPEGFLRRHVKGTHVSTN